MIRAKNLRPTFMLRGEVAVDAQELAELRRKAEAHDAYVRATQAMRFRESLAQSGVFEGDRRHWRDGWVSCLREFGRLIIEDAT